jgi:predicted dehydrogenase
MDPPHPGDVNEPGRRFGVAFVGAGMVAELHERALRQIRDATLVGVFDIDSDRTCARAAQWGCSAYDSFDRLLDDPTVDAVYVLTSFEAHERTALEALRRGRHVLVEKPVATPEGIVRLQRAADACGQVCLPGHNYAYQPEFAQLRRLIAESALGRVRAIWVTYVLKHPEEVAARYAGVLDEVMVHHSYLALGLLGTPAAIVAGRTEPAWERHPHDDQAWMTWTWTGGVTGHLFASFAVDDDTSDPWTFVVKVLGDRGGVTYSWRNAIVRRPLGTLSIGLPAYEDSYIHQTQALMAAARGDRSAIASSLDHALQAEQALAAARRSLRDGVVVRDIFPGQHPRSMQRIAL